MLKLKLFKLLSLKNKNTCMTNNNKHVNCQLLSMQLQKKWNIIQKVYSRQEFCCEKKWNPNYCSNQDLCDGRLKAITPIQVNLVLNCREMWKRQHKIAWIVIIKAFAFSLPSQWFLGLHWISYLFSQQHSWGLHTFLQLGCFGLYYIYNYSTKHFQVAGYWILIEISSAFSHSLAPSLSYHSCRGRGSAKPPLYDTRVGICHLGIPMSILPYLFFYLQLGCFSSSSKIILSRCHTIIQSADAAVYVLDKGGRSAYCMYSNNQKIW